MSTEQPILLNEQDTGLLEDASFGNKFTVQSAEKPDFNRFDREKDEDLSNKEIDKSGEKSWENLQLKSSPYVQQPENTSDRLHETQQKIMKTAEKLSSKVEEQRIKLSHLKFNDFLPYLIPLLLLTLGLASGFGLYRALFHRAPSNDFHLLKPDLSGNADFTENLMQQTPLHYHTEQIHHEKPSLLDRAKFTVNSNLHHAQDLVGEKVEGLKEKLEEAEGHMKWLLHYNNLKNSLGSKFSFHDKHVENDWKKADEEATAAQHSYKSLKNQLNSAEEQAESKAKQAFEKLNDYRIKVEERVRRVPPHQHDLPKH
jgi:hypothetical protein